MAMPLLMLMSVRVEKVNGEKFHEAKRRRHGRRFLLMRLIMPSYFCQLLQLAEIRPRKQASQEQVKR